MDKWQRFFIDTLVNLKKCSTCKRIQVSALLVKDRRILSTGVNGTASGQVHCCDYFRGYDEKSEEFKNVHRQWSQMHEHHAEANCLLSAARNGISPVSTDLYISLSPCLACSKLIVASGVKRVYFLDHYDRPEENGLAHLKECGVEYEQVSVE